MVAQHISTSYIMDLCEEAVRQQETRVSKWWWYQEGLDLAGARTAMEAAKEGEIQVEEGEQGGVSVNRVRRIKQQIITNKGQILLTLYPMFWVGTPPPNYEQAMGPQRPA